MPRIHPNKSTQLLFWKTASLLGRGASSVNIDTCPRHLEPATNTGATAAEISREKEKEKTTKPLDKTSARRAADPANPCASGDTGEEKARAGASTSARGMAGLLHTRSAVCLFSSFGESWGDLLCPGLRFPCQTHSWRSQEPKLLDLQAPGGPCILQAGVWGGGMLRNQDVEK